MKKKGSFSFLVSVFISLIKELSSLLECHARILCLFCNVQGRVSFSSFQKKKERKKERRWKTSIHAIMCFCIALVLAFLYVNDDVLCHM